MRSRSRVPSTTGGKTTRESGRQPQRRRSSPLSSTRAVAVVPDTAMVPEDSPTVAEAWTIGGVAGVEASPIRCGGSASTTVEAAATAAAALTTTTAVIAEAVAEGVEAAVPPLPVAAVVVVVAGPEGRRRGAGELPILAAVVAVEVARGEVVVAGRVQFRGRQRRLTHRPTRAAGARRIPQSRRRAAVAVALGTATGPRLRRWQLTRQKTPAPPLRPCQAGAAGRRPWAEARPRRLQFLAHRQQPWAAIPLEEEAGVAEAAAAGVDLRQRARWLNTTAGPATHRTP